MRMDLLLEDVDNGDGWMDDSACAASEPDWFTQPGHEQQALRVCRRCPVRVECGEHAELEDERFGIWGGVVRGWPT